jgi:hypothetical protein
VSNNSVFVYDTVCQLSWYLELTSFHRYSYKAISQSRKKQKNYFLAIQERSWWVTRNLANIHFSSQQTQIQDCCVREASLISRPGEQVQKEGAQMKAHGRMDRLKENKGVG